MRIVFLITMLLLASPAFAVAVDGNLTYANRGSANLKSTGSFGINVTKGDAVQISNLNDIAIANGSNGDRTGSDDVCYYATTTKYIVDLNSTNANSNGSGNFELKNGTKKVPYDLYWDDGKDGTTDFTFTQNSDAAQSFNSNNTTSANCQTTGGTNARITVFVSNASYNGASTGLYTDTVTVILKAQ